MDLVLFILVFFGFFLLGHLICRERGLVFADGSEEFVFCTSLGLVTIAFGFFLLSFLGLIYPAVSWGILLAIFYVQRQKVVNLAQNFKWWIQNRFRIPLRIKPLEGFDTLVIVILTLLLLFAFTLTQLPVTRTDSLVYHLAIPKAYLEHHGLTHLPNNMYSFFPLLFEMVYLFAMSLQGETLAVLCGWGMGLILLVALTVYFKRYLSGRFALLVPATFISVPTFWDTWVSAYIDVPLGAFTFLTFYAWDRWRDSGKDPWFTLMVIFAGAAVTTKLTAIIVLPLVFLGIVWQGRNRIDLDWTKDKLLVSGFILFAMLAPWWFRNYLFTANPFVPYFMQFFGGESGINWDPGRSRLLQDMQFGMGNGLKDFILLPINLTFFSEAGSSRFDGELGYLFLLLSPALLGLKPSGNRKVNHRLWVMAGVFGVLLVFWFINLQRMRYLTLALPFLSLILVYGFSALVGPAVDGVQRTLIWNVMPTRWQDWKRGLPLLAGIGLALNLAIITAQWVHADPLPFLRGKESREEYLTRRISAYPMYQSFNKNLGPRDKALFIYMRNLGYLCDRPFYSDTFFEAHTINALLKKDASPRGLLRQLKSMKITHIMFNFQFVFGEDSAIDPKYRESLKDFFNEHTRQLDSKNGYHLYRIVLD